MLNYRNTITGLVRLHVGNEKEPYTKIVAMANEIKINGVFNSLSTLAEKMSEYLNSQSFTKKGWFQVLLGDIRDYEVYEDWYNIDYHALAEYFWGIVNYNPLDTTE